MKKKDAFVVLEIEETEDKNLIKKAYRKKLTEVNPEDDPEGFMQLREAYESAMSDDAPEEEEEEEEEVQESPEFMAMTARLDELYASFPDRIRLENWQKLFEDSFFISLETGEEAFRCLMEYLMDHVRIPHRIMQFIMEHFEIGARRNELCQIYPDRFIDFLIQNGTFEDRIDYDIFEVAAEDVDEYIETFYRMSSFGDEGNDEEEEKELEKLDGLKSKHPLRDVYVTNRRLRFIMRKWEEEQTRRQEEKSAGEQTENAGEQAEEPKVYEVYADEMREIQQEIDSVLEKYPEQQDILRCSATCARIRRDYDLAEVRVGKLLEIAPDMLMNMMQRANLFLVEEKYKEASDLFMDILQKDRTYESAYHGMLAANEGQIRQYREALEEDPENDDKKIELAWCLFQNDHYEEALDAILTVAPEGENAYSFYNLTGRLYLYTGKLDKAMEHLALWEKEILKIDPDAMDEESIKRKSRLALSRYLMADVCRQQEKFDEARSFLESAEETCQMEGLDTDIRELRIRTDYEDGKYPEAFRETEQLMSQDPMNLTALLFQAKCLYQFDQNRDAYNLLNRLLELNPYEVDGWVVKLWILMDVDQEEDGLKLIDHCEEIGIQSEKLYNLKGRIASHLRDYALAEESFSQALKLAEDRRARGTAYLGLTASLCCLKKYEEAKSVYEDVFREFGWDTDFLTDYGELLVRMDDLEGAKSFLMQRIAERPDSQDDWSAQVMRMNLCCFCGNEGDVEMAYRLFRDGIAAHPKDLNAYRCMVEVLLEHGRAADAAKLMETGMRVTGAEPFSHYGLYLMALREANGDLSLCQDVVKKAREYFEDETRRIDDRERELIRKTEFYFAVGEYEKALKLIEERLSLRHMYYNCFAEIHGAYSMRGRIYSAMGEHEKAAEAFRKAIEIFGHNKLYEDYLKEEEESIRGNM